MKITIVPEDSIVIIDGLAVKLNLLEMPPDIRAVQFDTDRGFGHLEFNSGIPNQRITDILAFQSIVDRHAEALKPRLPTAEDLRLKQIAQLRGSVSMTLNELALATLPVDHPKRLALQQVEDQIATLERQRAIPA